ncbi:GtrA family protein [Demequina maris]|uniref:GtrA family protein n=1 Tax=Demequina maris TaxID=1638982 RepID=UPI000B23AC5A|nr:GtrA family protein [Demequina maris]
MFAPITRMWQGFEARRPGTAQFLMFFVFSNAVTVLQFVLMPLLRSWFASTSLLDTDFQVLPIGSNVDGSQYYMFDYPAGEISQGGGGGLAYFLAVQITLAIAQIINFFLQRNITFKSNTSPWIAAMWYFIAYVVITFVAAAAQGFYKAPVYDFFIDTLGWGSTGETVADVVTMIINSAISFWVFFPIFKIIFKRVPEDEAVPGSQATAGIVDASDGEAGSEPAIATVADGSGAEPARDGRRDG